MGHSQQPSSGGSPDSINAGHELTDVKIWPLVQFGIILALASAGSMWLVLELHQGMETFFDERAAVPHPMQSTGGAPAGPLLQQDEAKDYRAYEATQAGAVSGYVWIDKETDVVRVPIERAKELVLQESLPHRTTDK